MAMGMASGIRGSLADTDMLKLMEASVNLQARDRMGPLRHRPARMDQTTGILGRERETKEVVKARCRPRARAVGKAVASHGASWD